MRKTKQQRIDDFADRMKELIDKYGADQEVFHCFADKLIVEELKSLGYKEAMDLFDKQEIWYA